MRILIAPNAFKAALDARSAAEAIAEGLAQSKLNADSILFPIGDGGDGTAQLIHHYLNGEMISEKVHDPFGKKITAQFSWVEESKTAIIEMAAASGIRLLRKEELNPMVASSYGTGELIKAALHKGAKRILLCMGGSATVDGGIGILQALGIRFLNKSREELNILPKDLVQLALIDVASIDKGIHNCELVVLCDVTNPLLGNAGAATVFGPQKGASVEEVKELEKALTIFSKITFEQTGKDISVLKHGGTAGGAAAGLYAFLDASLANGIDYFLELTLFDAALKEADLVITGEGSLDAQTLGGKGPFGVAVHARQKDLPVIGLAGVVADDEQLRLYFNRLVSINRKGENLPAAMKNTYVNLVRAARELGDELAGGMSL
jgi:glycerate 2-kinase